MAVARVDEQPGAVSPVNVPVRAFLFKPGQPPSPDKPIPNAITDAALLATEQRECGHTD